MITTLRTSDGDPARGSARARGSSAGRWRGRLPAGSGPGEPYELLPGALGGVGAWRDVAGSDRVAEAVIPVDLAREVGVADAGTSRRGRPGPRAARRVQGRGGGCRPRGPRACCRGPTRPPRSRRSGGRRGIGARSRRRSRGPCRGCDALVGLGHGTSGSGTGFGDPARIPRTGLAADLTLARRPVALPRPIAADEAAGPTLLANQGPVVESSNRMSPHTCS